MPLKKVAISVAAALLLSQSSVAFEIVEKWQNAKQERIQTSEYERLSQNVVSCLKIGICQLCEITHLQEKERVELKKFLKVANVAREVALERIKKNDLACDKEVLYSVLSFIHIIESVLDSEFLELTGGYKMPSDILEFGKGLYALS